MATIQGKLSPLISNAHNRRRSLEICQKIGIGNKLLTPNTPTTPQNNGSPADVFFGRTPDKNIQSPQNFSVLNQSFSEKFARLGNDDTASPHETRYTKRRGSDSFSQMCMKKFQTQNSPSNPPCRPISPHISIPLIRVEHEKESEKNSQTVIR